MQYGLSALLDATGITDCKIMTTGKNDPTNLKYLYHDLLAFLYGNNALLGVAHHLQKIQSHQLFGCLVLLGTRPSGHVKFTRSHMVGSGLHHGSRNAFISDLN